MKALAAKPRPVIKNTLSEGFYMKSNSSDNKSTINKKKGATNDALDPLEKNPDTEKEIKKEEPDGDTGKKTVFTWSGKP